MDDEGMLLCLICGVDSNKKQKHDRYNYCPPMKKKGKYQKDEDSDSDDTDDSLMNSKSKKKAPQRSLARTSVGSRQTRNQNPKTFAASLCKVMEVPATPDHPFLQIFSRAHYCPECMPRVKEAHAHQTELENIQEKIREARVDFEIDLSKHLQAIPIRKNLTRNTGFGRYEDDIKQILDFSGNDKKGKSPKKEKEQSAPKRERRQAAINSSLKMKRKLEENESEEEEEEEEEEKEVKAKKPKKKEAAGDVGDKEFLPEESTSSETEKEEKEEPDGSDSAEAVETKEEEKDDSSTGNIDNGSKPIDDVKEEEKPVEIIKAKKDPNLKCPHCPIPRYFNIAANLEEHVSKAHAYVCDVCDNKTFKSESDLKKHKMKVHVQKPDEGSAYWICGFCDQEFQLKKYLEDHLDQHPEAKPLNCHQCGRGFSRKESLQKAFQIFKGENVEPCKNCGKNLNLKDYLEHNKSVKKS